MNKKSKSITKRGFVLFLMSFLLSIVTSFVGFGLVMTITFISNICFFGEPSFHYKHVSENNLGAWVILIPAVGGVIVS
jgi:CIC family chloride channel protein